LVAAHAEASLFCIDRRAVFDEAGRLDITQREQSFSGQIKGETID